MYKAWFTVSYLSKRRKLQQHIEENSATQVNILAELWRITGSERMFAELKTQRKQIREGIYHVNLSKSIKVLKDKYIGVLVYKCIII